MGPTLLEKTPETKPPNLSDGLVLPSNTVAYVECGESCFPILAKTQKYFTRGTTVLELVDRPSSATLVELDANSLQSRLEEHFTLFKWHALPSGEPVLKPSRCSAESAKALLKSNAARTHLPPIRTVTSAPIFVVVNDRLTVLEKGYHNVLGGVLISRDHKVVEVPLGEAVSKLLELLGDWDFVEPSDKSRALASLISPALRLGGLLPYDFPLDLGESDQSQSGKTYRQKVIAALYGEHPFVITQQSTQRGVGSLDESLSTAMLSARPFIILENVRRQVSSQLLESALRGQGSVTGRAAYSKAQELDTSGIVWMLSSNRAETTPDLANRSIITRIRKRPEGCKFKRFKEGDLLAHVRANSDYYLSSVFTVLKEWHQKGKPRTDDTRHDFREWCQSMDWIVQKVFELPALLDGHRSEQDRLSNPHLNWLREVALAVKKADRLGDTFRAGEFADLCVDNGIDIPGLRAEADEQQRMFKVGKIMAVLFKEAQRCEVGGFIIEHSAVDEYDARRRMNRTNHYYGVAERQAGP